MFEKVACLLLAAVAVIGAVFIHMGIEGIKHENYKQHLRITALEAQVYNIRLSRIESELR